MGTLYSPWLADAARLTGYPVIEVAGWRTRGHGGMRVVEGVIAHHTAGPRSGNYPSLNVVAYGRAGLAGPLSAYGLGRDGTIYVIAAGQSWHAGVSKWAGFSDLNDEFYGIEAESAGTSDDWTSAQKDCYPRLVAAILYYIRRGSDRLVGHKECALPIGRKPDPAFTDMVKMRAQVQSMLVDPLRRIPRFASPALPTPSTGTSNKRKPMLIERQLKTGPNYVRIACPVGDASGLFSHAWVSVTAEGGFKGQIAFQKSSDTDGAPVGAGPIKQFIGNNGKRQYAELPNATEFIEVWMDVEGKDGSVLIEFQPK